MDLFDILVDNLVEQVKPLCEELKSLPLEQQIDALNRIRFELHSISPFKNEPVDCVLWLPKEQVEPNDYNPNAMAPPELRLLKRSTDADGYTQPIVTSYEEDQLCWRNDDVYTVVDGEHRFLLPKKDKATCKRLYGRLPITVLFGKTENELMASTIRHNRARGIHGVIPMTEVIAILIRRGWRDNEIAKELGMDADEVLRFKQNKGLPELFKDYEYSKSWE